MRKLCISVGSVIMVFSFLWIPNLVAAQTGIAQLSGCTGLDCSACNVVDMANGGIKWLIGILFVVFALLLAIAGVKLVTSGGNHHALDEAKSSFTNAIIGFLIILSAWLIVDTIMRALVGAEGKEGQIAQIGAGGSVRGWLFWSQIECQSQVKTESNTVTQEEVVWVPLYDMDPEAMEGGGIVIRDNNSVGGGGGDSGQSGQSGGGNSLLLSLKSGGGVNVLPCDAGAKDRVNVNFLGGSVNVHKNLAPSLGRIDSRWRQMGGNSFYRVTSVGAYNCRNVAGTNRLSVHAYGLAIDINPVQNPYGSTLITNMPPQFISLFTAEGWGWGGNWRSSKDAMHYSKSRGEQGNMVGE